MSERKQYILWGTGSVSRKFLERYPDIKISHVVDGNIKKRGEIFCGHTVKSINDIKKIEDYQIIVASTFYQEIEMELLEKGLDKKNFFDLWNNSVVSLFSEEELQKQIDCFLREYEKRIDKTGQNILLVGRLDGTHKKNISCYLDKVAEQDKKHKWIFLSESSFGENKKLFQHMEMLYMPAMFLPNQCCGNTRAVQEMGTDVDVDFKDAATTMIYKVKEMSYEEALDTCKKAYDFYGQVLEICKPDRIYLWNEFIPLHKIFAKACAKRDIEVIYIENGLLPGTLAFDTLGMMGESEPAVYYEAFREIPVFQEERKHAEEVISFLRESGLNRYQQKEDEGFIQTISDKLLPERPIILFAGGLDYMGGIIPYNDRARKYHSPIFGSSEQAAQYLREIAKANEWNLIYKSHPWAPSDIESDEKGFICINGGNINDIIDICDLVVTIVSQVSYVALIRNKPVVMLGYIQLHGQGCTYEAFEKEKIQDVISEALEMGQQKIMKEAFVEHVARLEKSYLFDDGTEKGICIGKSIRQFMDDGGNVRVFDEK